MHCAEDILERDMTPSLGQPHEENIDTCRVSMRQEISGDRVLGAAVSLIARQFVAAEDSVGIETQLY